MVYLEVKNFKTKAVESMTSMFENCQSIKILDLSSFDTSSVTDMSYMFNGCILLDFLNISNFTEDNIIKYNYIFNNTRENLVYCLKGKEKSDSILLKNINNKLCPLDDCGINWNEKQKIMNIEENKCIDNCLQDEVFKYRFKSKCYDKCPNGTYLSIEEIYKCDYFCEENSPFYSYFQSICLDECSPYNFFKKECTINNPLLLIQEIMTNLTDIHILNDEKFKKLVLEQVYNNNESLIIETNEQVYQINSFKKGVKLNVQINFTDMQSEFNKIYNLSLVIFSTEIKLKGLNIPVLQYYIYDLSTETKLNLSKASDLEINYKIPVQIEDSQEYKYNPYDKYYFEPCIKSVSKDGFDMIINDRIDEYINSNISLCEKNCEFISLDSQSKIVTCKCKIKDEFKSLTQIMSEKEVLNTYIKRNLRKTNFHVLGCGKIIFESNSIWKNFGNYFTLFIFLLLIISCILFIKYGYDNLKAEIVTIVTSKVFLLDYEEKKKKPNQRKARRRIGVSSILFSNDPMLKSDILNGKVLSLNIDKIPVFKDNLKFTDTELNWNTYDFVIEKDKRTLIQYYLSLVRRKNYITFTFLPITDYNSKIIKIYLFFVYIFIYILINTFFFNESLIHQIYIKHGNIFFNGNFSRIFCSTIISYIIIIAIRNFGLTEEDIIRLKQINKKEKFSIYYSRLLKRIFKKYLIFGIINICVLTFSWWYLTCFCSIYSNTQSYLLINSLISFILGLLYPFIFCFIPALLRYYALRNYALDREQIYKISRILQLF